MSKTLVTVAVLSALTFTTQFASADDTTPGPKSRNTAIALSAGGTALSIGLVVAGASTNDRTLFGAGILSSLVTPSAGEIYADGNPFTWGMGIRAVSSVVAIVGFNEAFQCFLRNDTCHDDPALATTLIGAGAVGYATGIVYDLATAGTAVDEYNKKFNLHVAPTLLRTTSSSPTVGVGIGGSF
jgi:hypothetical protein